MNRGSGRKSLKAGVLLGVALLASAAIGTSTVAAHAKPAKCPRPADKAWSFGVLADTQWTVADDGKNPNSRPSTSSGGEPAVRRQAREAGGPSGRLTASGSTRPSTPGLSTPRTSTTPASASTRCAATMSRRRRPPRSCAYPQIGPGREQHAGGRLTVSNPDAATQPTRRRPAQRARSAPATISRARPGRARPSEALCVRVPTTTTRAFVLLDQFTDQSDEGRGRLDGREQST